ncbi:MAG: chemotaxis-specific protein-glutamate methyltransferase CheB, partial [Cyanobacteriota bacterium]|nr:chemotaxis-specific protein-glutamate methyltransferase CheB [Cyanobacteriota bacterium]
MRIAIVNDLPLAVRAIRRVLEHDGRHSVAWVAGDGDEALARCGMDCPDLILLDLVMPRLNGVETTRRLQQQGSSCPILIVTASVGGRAGLVFEALGEGALDAVRLPVLTLPPAESGRELLGRIGRLERLGGRGRPSLVAIGCSTGGPGALARLLGAIPAGMGAAFVVVQHIEARFAAGMAQWLDGQIPMPVIAAKAGSRPAAGVVSLAHTDDHLVIDADGRFQHTAEPRDQPYRPSVDVFFQSLRRHWPRPGQAVLLTGMGRDGAEGLLALREAGWHTIAQDEASSVVYGMPRAA